MRKRLTGVALLAMAFACPLAGGANANLGLVPPDDAPCGDRYYEPIIQGEAQVCSLTRIDVPVYESFEEPFFGDNDIVGYLNSAAGNFFMCQIHGDDHAISGTSIENIYWAFTLADNGDAGWVPQTYFAGGGNNVPDATLEYC